MKVWIHMVSVHVYPLINIFLFYGKDPNVTFWCGSSNKPLRTSGASASTLWAVTRKLMAGGMWLTASGLSLTSLVTSRTKASEFLNLFHEKYQKKILSN